MFMGSNGFMFGGSTLKVSGIIHLTVNEPAFSLLQVWVWGPATMTTASDHFKPEERDNPGPSLIINTQIKVTKNIHTQKKGPRSHLNTK